MAPSSAKGVRVGLGFTATVNTDMRVASLQETVTVTGESPVVDVSATTTATNFGQERLAALPNARDFWTVLAASPAIVVNRIDVGGSAAGTQTGYSAYDTKADQHRPMVEGIVNTEGTGAAGFYYDYGAIDEVAVETKGHTAEMPWPGVLVELHRQVGRQPVSRQDLRRLPEQGRAGAQHRRQPATFLCPSSRCGDLQPSDLNRLESYHDLNGDVGGYLKKDKLWWYGSLRDQNIKVRCRTSRSRRSRPACATSRQGHLRDSRTTSSPPTASGAGSRNPTGWIRSRIGATAARHTSEDSTWQQLYWGHTYKAGYESVLSDSTFVEVRGGQFRYVWPNYRYSEAPAYQDIGNQIVSGGNRDGWFRTPSRNQVAGSMTYFNDGWGGNHNFKVGGEWFRETFTDERGIGVDGSVPGDVLHILNNGVPARGLPVRHALRVGTGTATYGLYVQDTWRLNSRLTLNLGIRFDQYRNFLPEQEGPPVGRFNTTQLDVPGER